jgi:dipeptidyl aminopeptidase/acylaminoacyl peptidase
MVTTRIGDATHLHRLAEPKGKRIPLTRGPEPIRNGAFQPGGTKLLYVADQGGDENYQLWLVDTADPKATPARLTDGKSRNTDATWSKDGQWIAYATNRREVKASDIVLVKAANPREERVLLRHDTPGWGIADWSADGTKLLLRVANGQEDTRLWTVDVATGVKAQVSPKTGKRILAQARFGDGDRAVYALRPRVGLSRRGAPRARDGGTAPPRITAALGRRGACALRGRSSPGLHAQRGRLVGAPRARPDRRAGTRAPRGARRGALGAGLAARQP